MKIFITILLLLLVFAGAETVFGNDAVEITEWTVPWKDTRPRDPFVDSLNRVRFVGQTGDYIAYLSPETGRFIRFDLEPGTGPHNLVVDKNGQVWYAGNLKAYIGKLDPETGRITKYTMPNPEAGDPHTLVFDRRENIWFTVQRGNFVGRFSTSSGQTELISVPTPRARPYGIVVDFQNRPWIAEVGTHKLATVDPTTLKIEEVLLPRKDARPRRLGVTSGGHIWQVDYAGGFLGRFTPATGRIQEWPTPGGTSARPYGMAVDDRDRLWFVECGPNPNRFVGFDPETETFFSITEIGSGGGTVRHMFYHKQDREVWFGTDTNTIARARVP